MGGGVPQGDQQALALLRDPESLSIAAVWLCGEQKLRQGGESHAPCPPTSPRRRRRLEAVTLEVTLGSGKALMCLSTWGSPEAERNQWAPHFFIPSTSEYLEGTGGFLTWAGLSLVKSLRESTLCLGSHRERQPASAHLGTCGLSQGCCLPPSLHPHIQH